MLQEEIRTACGKILEALSPESKCGQWLGGSDEIQFIQAIYEMNMFGHGTFYSNGNLLDEDDAAITGSINPDHTKTGIPEGYIFAVNNRTAFFIARTRDNYTIRYGPRNYLGGTLRAQASILIHELAHSLSKYGLGASGFKHDFGDGKAEAANNRLVDQNCRDLIEGLD